MNSGGLQPGSTVHPVARFSAGDRRREWGEGRPRFLEFFAANIRNPYTRRAYGRAVSRFSGVERGRWTATNVWRHIHWGNELRTHLLTSAAIIGVRAISEASQAQPVPPRPMHSHRGSLWRNRRPSRSRRPMTTTMRKLPRGLEPSPQPNSGHHRGPYQWQGARRIQQYLDQRGRTICHRAGRLSWRAADRGERYHAYCDHPRHANCDHPGHQRHGTDQARTRVALQLRPSGRCISGCLRTSPWLPSRRVRRGFREHCPSPNLRCRPTSKRGRFWKHITADVLERERARLPEIL